MIEFQKSIEVYQMQSLNCNKEQLRSFPIALVAQGFQTAAGKFLPGEIFSMNNIN